ncbi:MAG TPA: 4-(cytidine 5'-diphospho)-2-C-methyl-D-erythritol kinase [Terriglobia bacterium]|nr:4-(cytidine 5'-diphospho)-2-C-methyl-D-erythritol kinase [Terriglobia bacterium]
MPLIHLRAFAKINLGLRILGQRPDGYHEIRTVYQTVTLHDQLEVCLRPAGRGSRVECDDPAVPTGPANLVHKACELWRKATRFRGGISVRLEKVIPAGSGLGGASSDAAATLLGLERLTGDRLNPPAWFSLVARLGSDVPLFLWGGRVLGCGRGEEVYPLDDLPRRHCLVVFPGFSISTVEAYREAGVKLRRPVRSGHSRESRNPTGLQLTKGERVRRLASFGLWPQLPLQNWGPAENDFEKVVFAKWPELARLKRQLLRAGAETASLTGSGSAVYGLFVSARQLAQAQKLIPARWRAFKVKTLGRAEYWRGIAGRLNHRVIEPSGHFKCPGNDSIT